MSITNEGSTLTLKPRLSISKRYAKSTCSWW